NGAWTTTSPAGVCSHVARLTTPNGPGPPSALIPNRLLPWRVNRLRPQSDSRIAWATVTLAGTPVAWCDVRAAAPTASMKSADEPNAWDCPWPAALASAGSGTGGVIGPTSDSATHATPGTRPVPSPKNCTSRRVGSDVAPGTMRSLFHWGRSV